MGNITTLIATDLITTQNWYCYEPTIIDKLVGFMLWDGVALVIFVGIIALGIRGWRTGLGLILALCIPVADLVLVGAYSIGLSWPQPFLHIWVVALMFFVALLIALPRFIGTSTA